MLDPYDRETHLITEFNAAVVRLLEIEGPDYYSNLPTVEMLRLKAALSNINNIITLRLTDSLAEWICQNLGFSKEKKHAMLEKIRSQKPNANGYDIDERDTVVAEVKCNVPVNNGVRYGAAQKKGLENDIDKLLEARKSFKILGLYLSPEVREATEHFVKNLSSERKKKTIIFESQSERRLDKDHVYVVFIELANNAIQPSACLGG